MSLQYLVKLKNNLKCSSCIALLEKETPEFIPPQLWPTNNPADYRVCGILQQKVYKTRITDLELSTTPLTNGCRNDNMIQLDPLRSQSLFQFVQISDAYFKLLAIFSHSIINRIQIWRIWRPHLR